MEQNKMRILAFLLFTSFLAALGQTVFKLAFLNPGILVLLIAAGLVAYIISTVYYLFALSRVHLSWAYGIGGLSYVFAVMMAYLFLGEMIPPLRWLGVAIIFIGVVLVGTS